MNKEVLWRIDECKKNKNSELDLSDLELSEIPREIGKLYWLEKLKFFNTQLSRIEGLENLRNLTYLGLGSTQLSKIEGLDNLKNLTYLGLGSTRLSKIEGLGNLKNLTSLDLSGTQLLKIEGLGNLKNLMSLELSDTQLSKIEGLENLTNLKSLYLSNTQIPKMEGLENLTNLKSLYLSNTQISKVEGLETLTNLRILNLSNTEISKIAGFERLINLRMLNLSNTKISKIEGLENLTNLTYLNLGNNTINEIEDFSISFLEQLEVLDLSDNPIEELPESALGNVKAIIGFLKVKKEKMIENRHLKVNILGDGRIGKTQLFNYFKKTNYVENQAETHGTNTTDYIFKEDYQAKVWDFGGQSYHHGFHHIFIRPSDFNIVLWVNDDTASHNFSYWLGTARNYAPNSPLFLVQNVWSEAENKNVIEYPDSNKLKVYSVGLDSVFAIDVRALHQSELSWQNRHDYFIASLHQAMEKHTQTNKVFREIAPQWLEIKKRLEQSISDEIYLHKQDFKEEYANELVESDFEILLIYLEFSGNILYFQGNEWLREYIFINPPKLSDWIYQTILDKEFTDKSNGVLDFQKLIDKDGVGEDKAWLFREIMNGFNLIFDEVSVDDNEKIVIPQFLPDIQNAFKKFLFDLIPSSFSIRFADFIHESRIFQFISQYGKYAKDTSSYWRYGIIFEKDDVKALVYYNQSERIINVHLEKKEGRLRLAQEIFDFFVRKEKEQIFSGMRISRYAKLHNISSEEVFKTIVDCGFDLPDNPNGFIPIEALAALNRKYSEKLNTDKSNSSEFSIRAVDPRKIVSSDFSTVSLALKHAADTLSKREELRPDDVIEGAQLSVNGLNYYDIKYTLLTKEDNANIGICVDSQHKKPLTYLELNLLNMITTKLPKVFISYSRKDVEFKEELVTHLALLEQYDLLKAWTCDKIEAGKWNAQIQNELEEADIIVYMISANFMASRYIMENEVKKGIKLVEENPNKKIITVIVRECPWKQWTLLEEKYNASKEVAGEFVGSKNPTQYQYLPYHEYKNAEGSTTRQEVIALERWGRMNFEVRNVAYQQIVNMIMKAIK